MAAMWNQGGQPQMATAPRRGTNPPPVCFNCDREGHFVVDCPHPSRLNTGAFPPPPAQQLQTQAPPQPYQPQPGPPPGQFQPQPQYQAQVQYPPPQQNHHYPPPVQQPYSQVPTPQSYNAPPTGHYSRPGYQPQPYSQFPPQNVQSPYGPSVYQRPQGFGSSANPPYQSPPTNFGPQTNGYNSNYGTAPVSHSPPQQWNNAPPPSRNAPPYQRQQRSMSQLSQTEFSGTPSNHTYQQMPQQTPRQHHRPMAPQQVSHPSNPTTINHGPAQLSRGSSAVLHNETAVGSSASSQHDYSLAFVSTNGKSVQPEEQPTTETVEESPEPEDQERQFDWDCKYIFKEPQEAEVVALAQPLSTTFDMTPVPQVDTRSIRSVSRHARIENLKEYVKSIRDAPHWSFAQEDPVFTDLKMDSPLIPIENVPAWIAERQGIVLVVEDALGESSRKRAWPIEPEDIDAQIALEMVDEAVDESRPTKRQKNDQIKGSDDNMTEARVKEDPPAPGTPCLGTANLDRSGPEAVDDAWAPEPGEVGSASSPIDPTEALLASLGVTGEAKPAESESLPPYNPSEEEEQNDSHEQAKSKPPVNDPPAPSPMPSHHHSVDGQHALPTAPPLNHRPQVAPQAGPQYGQPNNPEYGGSRPVPISHQTQPYEPQRSASWSSGPPSNPAFGGASHSNTPHYGLPINPQHQAGQPPAPPANTQYNPQRSASYPNPQFGPPQYSNVPQPNTQYGYGGGSQNSQYYGQQPYANGQAPAHYGGPQYATHSYANSSPQGPPQWANGQQQYNNAPYGPPQYQNGPPIQQPYGNAAYGPFQYANGPSNYQPHPSQAGPPQYGNGSMAQSPNGHFPHGQQQYPEMPPIQQPFNNYQQGPPQQSGPLQIGIPQNQPPYDHMPPRQDSGYISASGSYSNGTGQNGFNHESQNKQPSQSPNIENPHQENHQPKSQAGMQNGKSEVADRGTSDSEPDTPLSPTSAEILGKLVRQPGDKRKAGSGDEARKAKRPQPVVAEAYSRRW